MTDAKSAGGPAGADSYRAFVSELGWTHDEWTGWVAGTLLRELFER